MTREPDRFVARAREMFPEHVTCTPSCTYIARVAAELAAAEECGRRRGVEAERERWKYSQRVIAILVQRQDNIALISKSEQDRLDPRIVIETVVKHDGALIVRLARDLSESALATDKAESALAPRDSGKEG
jgi:hypothetical protein